MSWVRLKIFMGGEFTESEGRPYYLGGLEEDEVVIDVDTISWSFFLEYVRDHKVESNVKELWYKMPNQSLDDRKIVREEFSESDIQSMISFARECGELDVFVEHHLSQPLSGDKLVDVNVDEERPRDMNVDEEDYSHLINVGVLDGCYNDEDDFAVDVNDLGEHPLDMNVDPDEHRDDDVGGYNSEEDDDFVVASSSDGRISDDDDDSCLGDTPVSSDDDFVEEIPVMDGLESEPVNDEREDEAPSDDYVDSDEYIPVTPDGSDEESEKRDQPSRQPVVFPREDLLYLGKTFNSGEEFKRALLKYALSKQFNVKLDRWEKTKLSAICCTEGCPWRVYCSVEIPINKWLVKIYKGVHSHVPDSYINLYTMNQIAKEYAERFRREPDWKAEKLQIAIQEDHGVTVPISKCFKARRIALKMVMEDPSIQIGKLWDYELELRRSNPNTTTEVTTKIAKKGNQVFDSFYVSFEVLRNSWRNHCRPVIGLDGCFLKWDMKGELLAAIGRDANNGIYPLAWAVVRVESIESWNWFIRKLRLDLGLGDGHNLTILSDKQKGLLNAVQKELPFAEHRMCTRHVYANWKKQFKDAELKYLFWKAAKSYLEREYEECVKDIKRYNPLAYDAFVRAHPKRWCRAFFRAESKCHDIHNNLSESFNFSIKEARSRPIIDMLEDIRRKAMKRISRRSREAARCVTEFPPRIMKILEKYRKNVRFCNIIHSGHGKYEVAEFGISYGVDLSANTCGCRRWQLRGIPCQHAQAVIKVTKQKIAPFMSHYYLKTAWEATYANNILPVNGEPLWQRSGRIPIEVPEITKMPGRPKLQKRLKDAHESPSNPGHITRHGRIFRCSNCKQTGHNVKTCQQPKISREGASSSTALLSTSNAPRKRRQQGPSTSNALPTTSVSSAEGATVQSQSSQTSQSGIPLNSRRRLLLGMSSTTREQPFSIPRQVHKSNNNNVGSLGD